MPVNPHEGGASSARLRPQQGKIKPIAALMTFSMFDIASEHWVDSKMSFFTRVNSSVTIFINTLCNSKIR